MVGGSPEALEAVRPILDHFSANVFHMGAPGSGHVAKLLNNFLNGVSLAATAEVMVAARKSGLDLERFLDVLNNSSGVNFATLEPLPEHRQGRLPRGRAHGQLMAKDVRLYLEHVTQIGVPTFSGPACLATFEVANARGYGDEISNRVVDGIGDLAGGIRLQEGAMRRHEAQPGARAWRRVRAARPTFTGTVWSDPVLRDRRGVLVNTVFFPPAAARTGTATSAASSCSSPTGAATCDARRRGRLDRPGDVVYFAPGEEHWHGAGPEAT